MPKPTKEYVKEQVFEMLNLTSKKAREAKDMVRQYYANNYKYNSLGEGEVRFAEGMQWGLLMCLQALGLEVEQDYDELESEYVDDWTVRDWGILED
jgi:hypothetical protein